MDIPNSTDPPSAINMEEDSTPSTAATNLSIENKNKVSNENMSSTLNSINEVNNDLKPEFGSMETIPLEVSIQESASKVEAQNKENSDKIPALPTDSTTNDLSKYFSVEVSKNKADSDGINFFNTLAKSKEQDAIFNIEKKDESPQVLETNTTQEISINETVSSTMEDSAEVTEKQPQLLLRFFSEEKSGQDKDGKAFFDKIAEDKVVGGIPTLEINEPIVKTPATEFFLSSPTANEIEDAWIPSDRTRQILVSIILSKVPFTPDKSDLTMPGVIVEEEMEDPVKTLLIECNSPFAHQRKVLTANDVSEDEPGLQKLMEAKCYHAAINLTKRLLASYGQGLGCDGKLSNHSPQSLKLWYSRLALLVKLKKFSLAEVESAAFGDLDKCDLYYEFYPDLYKGRRGSMVPFALRLLLAELPQYQGNHQIALDNMYKILNIIQKMLNNVQNGCAEDGSMIELSEARKSASLEVWRKREIRVLFSILNCVLTQKDYIVAVAITRALIKKSGSDTAQLHSALGRIYLQLGDVQYAEKYFKEASLIAEQNKQDFRVEESINNALLSVACDENEKAFQHFEQAYSIEPRPMLVNNMAVCKLYTGQLKESLKLLESAIQKSPTTCLHDGLLFNVCTLYELESSRCPQKKLAMLELISKYAGDSFNVNCLKIKQ